MKIVNKKLILLFCLVCCFLIPNVKGIERVEKTLYCQRGFSYNIFESVTIEQDEVISWDFTTYNNSFEASLALWINTFSIVTELCVQQANDIGEYKITQTGSYRITVSNFGLNDGYIHIVVENKEGISGYPLFLMFGLVGIVITGKIVKMKVKK